VIVRPKNSLFLGLKSDFRGVKIVFKIIIPLYSLLS